LIIDKGKPCARFLKGQLRRNSSEGIQFSQKIMPLKIPRWFGRQGVKTQMSLRGIGVANNFKQTGYGKEMGGSENIPKNSGITQ